MSEPLPESLNLQQAVTEGIDSQVALFQRLLPEAKRLKNALNALNDYQRTLESINMGNKDSLNLDQVKVKSFVSTVKNQLSLIEERLVTE